MDERSKVDWIKVPKDLLTLPFILLMLLIERRKNKEKGMVFGRGGRWEILIKDFFL